MEGFLEKMNLITIKANLGQRSCLKKCDNLSIYALKICSGCKKKAAIIVLKSLGYSRVLFSLNISITRKKFTNANVF